MNGWAATRPVGVPFLKGHGTGNDFVVLPDPDGRLDLTAPLVARICDRRHGVGGDGVLRVVRSMFIPDGEPLAGMAEWFMDYRNADGSVAQMCGNGVRVFVRFLLEAGLVPGPTVPVGTRAGLIPVTARDDGWLTADMGPAALPAEIASVRVSAGGRTWPAVGVLMPNPHAVAFVSDLADAGALREPPMVEPATAYPEGVNVEFVTEVAAGHVAMRVHERGVGETRSCGTGACAVGVVARRRAGLTVADEPGRAVTVDVPGGRLVVVERGDGRVELSGPAVIVAEGVLRQDWLDGEQR